MSARGAVPVLVLKAGRDKSVKRRHPWVFSGAVEKVLGDPQSGGDDRRTRAVRPRV